MPHLPRQVQHQRRGKEESRRAEPEAPPLRFEKASETCGGRPGDDDSSSEWVMISKAYNEIVFRNDLKFPQCPWDKESCKIQL